LTAIAQLSNQIQEDNKMNQSHIGEERVTGTKRGEKARENVATGFLLLLIG